MKKKLLAAVLSVVMLMSLLPGAAFAVDAGETCTDGDACQHEAAIGDIHYSTLAEAVSALKTSDTKTLALLGDVENSNYTSVINITLPAGATLEGNGHTLSGNIAVYVNAAGGTVQNVNFKNIHNSTSKLSALYASGLTGTLTVKGCEFDTCDWDAIQTTPKAGAVVDIQDNTFRNTGEQGINTRRYVHVESAANTDFTVTVTNNKFYDGSKLLETALEVYYPTDLDKVKLSGNYIAEPVGVCIITQNGTISPNLAVPFASEDFKDNVYPATKKGSSNIYFYLTLQEAINTVTSSSTITLIKDVNEAITIPVGKTITLKTDGYTLSGTITNQGKLKVSNSSPADRINSVITNTGTVELTGGIYGEKPDDSWIKNNDYGSFKNDDGTYTVRQKTSADLVAEGYVVYHPNYGAYKTLTEGFNAYSTMYLAQDVAQDVISEKSISLYTKGYNYSGAINNGKFGVNLYGDGTDSALSTLNSITAKTITVGGSTGTAINVVVNNGTIENANKTTSGATLRVRLGSLTVNDGSYSSPEGYVIRVENGGTMTINGGAFNGALSNNGSLIITGGYFTSDPTQYIPADSGKTAIPGTYVVNGKSYKYMVAEPLPEGIEVVSGETVVSNPNNVDKDVVSKVVDTEADGLSEAANKVAGDQIVPENIVSLYNEKLPSGATKVEDSTNITYVIVPYLDIAVQSYNDANQKKELTLNIQAVYDIKATTATTVDRDSMVEWDNTNNGEVNDVNTVTITEKAGQLDTTGTDVQISIPLPSGFVSDTTTPDVYVNHIKDNKTYVYKADVEGDETDGFTATFTNPHGFSTFVLTTETAASITDEETGVTTYYATLQDAVNAVQNGQTITLLADGLEATVPNQTISFKVVSGGGDDSNYAATIKDYKGNVVEPDEGNVYTFTRQSSGSSGSGATTYPVTTPTTVTNGSVTVSPKSAAKNATVTLTVTPDEGYQLDKLTVTDKDGNVLALTDQGNGKYTFVMPASKVDVSVTFAKIPETHVCPSAHFTDISTSQWYHEAVDYVVEAGMMNGTAPTLFEPDGTTTRGMIVTILYRLEGSPAVTAANPFTDVAEGQWYSDAVIWAAANGVVTGDTPTTFSPDDPITREQMAAILYRYAAFKGYDVTGRADLTGYTDAGQISDYAKEAMAWTNAENLIGGVSTTTLQPQGSALRAQAATILMRFCQNVAK